MAEDAQPKNSPVEEETKPVAVGVVSSWLTENGFDCEALELDKQGVEILKVEPDFLIPLATALYAYGFNYLQCQGGYDNAPGGDLVSFYHLIKVTDNADKPEEVRLKVFLPRDNPTVPSVYWIWKGCGLARTGVLRYVRHRIRGTPESETVADARGLGRLAPAEGLHLA